MDEQGVLAANAAFYDAFSRRDVEAMTDLWAADAPVSCIHPSWECLEGRDQVISSWLAILANPGAPRVQCANAVAHLAGDVAYVVCNELIEDVVLTATNIFVREAGEWKMMHHHASPTAQVAREPRGGAGSKRREDLN